MVQLSLPKNSVPIKGNSYSNVDLLDEQSQQNHDIRVINVYRWSGDENTPPQIDRFEIDVKKAGTMVLDILNQIKAELDPSLTFRKSCREGVCGSCAMNIDGVNTLACQKNIEECSDVINIYPLPHMKVIKDLVVDLKKAFEQFKSIKPWLSKKTPNNKKENYQSIEDRDKLDGMWECVMCFSCSTSCPSYWWNEDKYLGPAVLLQANRWIQDSRDEEKKERLAILQEKLNKLSFSYSRRMMGSTQRCLVTGPSKKDPGELQARTINNRIVNFKRGLAKEGDLVDVEIVDVFSNSLRGRLLDGDNDLTYRAG